jgi:lipopolysaccharide biosynthesis regulator YciM
MGFLSRSSSSSSSKIDQLQADLEKRPKDARLMQDLAAALKEKGATEASVEMSLRAARHFMDEGFHQKAVAIAKQMMVYAPTLPQAFELLVECYQALKLKEDERGVLKQLLKVYGANSSGNAAELARVRARLEELGPGR